VFYVYLLASRKQGTLYLGVTNDLIRRVYEHKEKITPGFTTRYDIRRLVWFECYDDAYTAISREKGNQKMAPRLEDGTHRERESGLERFVPRNYR
jgi:putative endonuclease